MKMTLNSKTTPFNLDYTLQCGQVFRWQKHDHWWQGVVMDNAIRIRQEDTILEFEGANPDFIEKYFRLTDPLPLITWKIGKDHHIKNAINAFSGLRLIHQEPWECLISYICATFSNIPRIKKMINNLAEKFGNKRTIQGYTYYTFPTVDNLAKADLKELTSCKLGFRAKSVLETAKRIDAKTVNLTELQRLNYRTAKKELLTLPGVGDKVADCVLLFALNKLEAFPVDVWMKRAILEHYAGFFDDAFVKKALKSKSITHKEYERMSSFAREHFGVHAGYAQQYLYHFERKICEAV